MCRLAADGSYHRSYTATMEMARPEEMTCTGHGYMNMPRPLQQVLTIQVLVYLQKIIKLNIFTVFALVIASPSIAVSLLLRFLFFNYF